MKGGLTWLVGRERAFSGISLIQQRHQTDYTQTNGGTHSYTRKSKVRNPRLSRNKFIVESRSKHHHCNPICTTSKPKTMTPIPQTHAAAFPQLGAPDSPNSATYVGNSLPTTPCPVNTSSAVLVVVVVVVAVFGGGLLNLGVLV